METTPLDRPDRTVMELVSEGFRTMRRLFLGRVSGEFEGVMRRRLFDLIFQREPWGGSMGVLQIGRAHV